MRYKLRITRAIAVVIFVCTVFYLYAPDRLSDGLTEHIPSLKSLDISSYRDQLTPGATSRVSPDKIRLFWRDWSKVFHDARPQAGRIVLSSNASPVGIKANDHGPRDAPRNRVTNSEADVEALRTSHATLLSTLLSADTAGDIYEGTGVVMMGGGEYFGPAIIGLHMLRKTGNILPVEIFVANSNEYEPSVCEGYLPRLGARCLILTDFLGDNSTADYFEVTHYQLKSLAMLFSSFAEVLYLDSDSIPLVDPSSEMFSTDPYKTNGLVIWPDFWIATESPHFYTIVGLPGFPSNLPKSSSEAGQLLINKRTHLKTLLLANYYNIYGPDYYYPLLSQGVLGQGDKETFMAAALVTGESFYRVQTAVAGINRHNGKDIKGSGMVQFNPSDDLYAGTQSSSSDGEEHITIRPAFFHANTPKMNAGHLVDEGDLFAVDHSRLRLWGPKEDQERKFGYDLEIVVWELLLATGCELEHVIGEWKHREGLCERLREHWEGLFRDGGI